MIKLENTEVYGWEATIRGMRNPMNSWDKSDSSYGITEDCRAETLSTWVKIGANDLNLMKNLSKAGNDHGKFLRMINVTVDITAPLYWWKEFDTYKVGTVANSTSTMHKMASKPITVDCFEIDDYDCSLQLIDPINIGVRVDSFIDDLEQLRQLHLQYLEASKREGITEAEKKHLQRVAKRYWKELIRWLPESWLQTRTVTFNYENLLAICSRGQRRFHKLNEWSGIDDKTLTNFISWARELPYAQEFIFIDEKGACEDA